MLLAQPGRKGALRPHQTGAVTSPDEINGFVAEDVVKSGTTLTFENFTVQSKAGGRDLVGPLRSLQAFIKEHGATRLVFRGTFSNAELAAKFGKQVGDSFEVVTGATQGDLFAALREFGGK